MSDSPLAVESFSGIGARPELELAAASVGPRRVGAAFAPARLPKRQRIGPVAFAAARLGIDLALLEACAALAHATAGTPPLAIGNAWLAPATLGLAPLFAVLWLARRGGYPIDGPGPRLRSFVIDWLSGSGLLVLIAILVEAAVARQPAIRLIVPPALVAFVILGGGAVLARQALCLALWPHLAARVKRVPAIVAGAGAFAYAETLRVHGRTSEVVAVVQELGAGADEIVSLVRRGLARAVVVVASAGEEEAAALALFERLAGFPVALRVIPDMPRLFAGARGVSREAGLPLVHVGDPPLGPVAASLKRAEDIALSALLLAAAAPVMLLAAIAIKLESPGPVLFRQPRDGLGGAEIEVFKFRTMYADCEDRLASRQTSRGDPRVTRVGAVLRRHSLDELPQLLNVLAGSMSLVGPRPHAPETRAGGERLEAAVADYRQRYRMKPGITGWAQVSGCRGNLDTLEKAVRRIERDLYYIEHWSLGLDLRILARSVRVVLHDKEAF